MNRVALVGLLALPCSVAFAGPLDRDVAETVARFEALRLGPVAAVATETSLRNGHATIFLRSGRSAPVLAGAAVVGFFFEGRGVFEYRSTDPVEFPVMSYNARKAAGLATQKEEKSLVLREDFERVLWLSAGAAAAFLPALSVPGASSLDGAFARHRELFGRARGAPPSHLLASQVWNAPEAPLVVAEIGGGKADLRYFYDDFEDRSEVLQLLYKPDTNDPEIRRQLFRATLSDQPIGRDRGEAAPAPFLLEDVRLDLTASDGKDATLSVRETVSPRGRPLSALRLQLRNKTYAYSGVGQVQVRTTRVVSVADAAGRPLAFHHQGDEVLVGLRDPALPGEPALLDFAIAGDFLIRPRGDSFWLLGMDPWFPQPDWNGQTYTFHAKVRVKKPFVPFAAGRTLSRRVEGDDEVVETEVTRPIQFAVVLAGRYAFEEETRGGLTVRVASYAGRNARAMKQLTNLAFQVVRYYESVLGPFPLPELQILEINEYGFGQAPPGILFLTREAFNPIMGETNRAYSQGVNERFAHEIAHQYWGHAVKAPSEDEQWLSESFAEYCAALFLKQAKGEGLLIESASTSYDRLLAYWKRGASDAGDSSPIPFANRVAYPGDPTSATRIRTGLLYGKGVLLLADLHRRLGDERFLGALRAYQDAFRWKFGSTKTFQGLLETRTRTNFEEFFRKYFWGTETPPS